LFFGLLTYLILQREKATILNIYGEEAARAVEVIAKDITFMMLKEDPADVVESIRTFNKTGAVQVGVVGPKGTPAFDTRLTVPREVFSAQKETYTESGSEFIFYKPLPNEERCRRCHNAADKTRGMIVIKTSMKKAREEIAQTAKRLMVVAFCLGLLSEVFLVAVLRKYILKPLEVLNKGAQSLKSGKLHHRVKVKGDDEIAALSSCFNEMAETIEKSHVNLENVVRQRTKELRVIAELSTKVFRGNLTLPWIAEQFLSDITERLDYSLAAICLIDKKTGLLSQEFRKGIKSGFCSMEISLASEHPFTKVIREARPAIRKPADIGVPLSLSSVVIVPILSHQRRMCREINLCTYEHCPAFFSTDERCWLINDTLCRSPQAVAGKGKIYGCLHCPAFPVLGVLIAGKNEEVAKSSLYSIEILASEVASAIENSRFIESNKEDISKLINLHDVSVESLQNLGETLSQAIVSAATVFSSTDASILWLLGKDGRLHLKEAFQLDQEIIPSSLPAEDNFVGRAISEERPVETIEMKNVECIGEAVRAGGLLYASSVPLKFKDSVFGCLTLFKKSDFFMTDSEKAITMLFASQAAAAMNTARIYGELKAEKELSDAIFGSAASGIMVLDKEGNVLKINSAGAEILGSNIATITGTKIDEIYPGAGEMLLLAPGVSREATITLPTGDCVPIGFANSPLFGPSDVGEGIIVLFRNLTEIKRLQSELRKKEHFETMARVISGVAHEIRNPLFGISSIGQILERELDSPQHRALTQAMLKETERMKRLIEELLLYTRPSRFDIREVDISLLLEELLQHMKEKRAGITFSLNVLPMVIKADRDKIMQVLLNLLNNAVDAAKSSIRMSVKPVDKNAVIVVTDDGPGIKREDLQRVFEPFFTTKKGGTGLGLPICKKIVEDHGGTIEIQSEEEKGTSVVLTLRS
jgi:signal transduction histidine kinase/HAMP domain-containing protein